MQNLQRRMIKKLYFLVVVAVTFALVTPAAAAPLPQPAVDQATGLLSTHFGVTLALQAPYNGGTYNAFDWDSFVPTLNTGTVDFTEGDWYGNWSESNTSFTTIQHATAPGTSDQDWYPSGGEWYDVEAMYFDNDANNIYVAIVTSVPFTITNPDFGTIAGVNATEVGVGDNRWNANSGEPRYWVRPGDLALSLFNGTARSRNATVPGIITMRSIWCTRIAIPTKGHPLGWGSVEMRDTNLGDGLSMRRIMIRWRQQYYRCILVLIGMPPPVGMVVCQQVGNILTLILPARMRVWQTTSVTPVMWIITNTPSPAANWKITPEPT